MLCIILRSLHLHSTALSFLIGAHFARFMPVRRRYYSIHWPLSIESSFKKYIVVHAWPMLQLKRYYSACEAVTHPGYSLDELRVIWVVV